MPRPAEHLSMTPQQKYEIFKRAFSTLNSYIKTKQYLAAHVIAFSILEDRVLATRIQCGQLAKEPIDPKINFDKIPFTSSVNKLKELKIIDSELSEKLLSNAIERNTFIHQAMWRLHEFNYNSIIGIRTNINSIEKSRRKFVRDMKDK